MHDRVQVRKYIGQLKQASIQAIDAGKFSRGVDLANAAKALQGVAGRGLLRRYACEPSRALEGRDCRTPR